MSKDDKEAKPAGTAGDGPDSGPRAPDVASAEAYAKDGILGAPGSEVPGAKTPVTPEPGGDADPRPQTQVEGEQLSADADAADPRLQGSGWLPGQAGAGEAKEDKDG